ncbi:hypothetical protein K450DRAFT_252789 [Umbelopsis ramanniana AG]|uniref:Uncharacterized protein n=1 Tax=Umbelopsis ramanniana AG TaxID=1314678 RepID=A0AAD5E5V6_UMBRA|nr:uncharacterized protein K450DRAFT_252789 [Umbelopsis ramanniana AG]KAI8577219.1 hypothetical protein K450DRAFT_252789 [Umbelopsis ramanniana AG]
MKSLLIILFLVVATFAWDVDKSSPDCTGIVVPGVLNTKTGVYVGNQNSACIAKHCKCRVIASGSTFPPKLQTLHCTDQAGCQYDNVHPMRRLASPGCQAAVLKDSDCL